MFAISWKRKVDYGVTAFFKGYLGNKSCEGDPIFFQMS